MSIKDEDKTAVAQAMGMKPSEIVDARNAPDGLLVKTHDRNWTLVREDGSFELRGKDPAGQVADEPGDEPAADQEPKKAAAKGRGQA